MRPETWPKPSLPSYLEEAAGGWHGFQRLRGLQRPGYRAPGTKSSGRSLDATPISVGQNRTTGPQVKSSMFPARKTKLSSWVPIFDQPPLNLEGEHPIRERPGPSNWSPGCSFERSRWCQSLQKPVGKYLNLEDEMEHWLKRISCVDLFSVERRRVIRLCTKCLAKCGKPLPFVNIALWHVFIPS